MSSIFSFLFVYFRYFSNTQRKRDTEGSDEEKETPGKEKKKSKKDKKKSKEKESSDEVSSS